MISCPRSKAKSIAKWRPISWPALALLCLSCSACQTLKPAAQPEQLATAPAPVRQVRREPTRPETALPRAASSEGIRLVSGEEAIPSQPTVQAAPAPRPPSPALARPMAPVARTSYGAGIAGPTVYGAAPFGFHGLPTGQCSCGLPHSCEIGTHHFSSDEYLCNGGDQQTAVRVRNDWTVVGLHSGDTIAHYDTLTGETRVTHTNDVCIYAPRFASVRRVTGVVQHEQLQRGAGVDVPLRLAQTDEAEEPTTVLQPLQLQRNRKAIGPNSLRERTRTAGLEETVGAVEQAGDLLPYEDFAIIRFGKFDNSEKARLATRLAAAQSWTGDLPVQVLIDDRAAVETSGNLQLQSVHEFELPPGKPRLRIVKLASESQAQPGDTVDFTIRFDNVGDRKIGNVTVIDHLITRLEYVEDSQNCSVDADFFTQPNDSGSLTLRWEIREPMEVGDGGVIRFTCRVR